MELALAFSKSSYLVGEDIPMTVSVTNRDAAAVEIPDPFHANNWQPAYTLTGPQYPDGHRFSFRSFARQDPRPDPTGTPAVLTKLAPGATLKRAVPLHSWAPLTQPGTYQIVAQLTWKDISVKSKPAQLVVARPAVVSASVGVDVAIKGSPGEWIDWLHGEGAARRVYSALFKRARIDIHGYDPFSVTPIFEAGPQATDMLSPWTNYDRMSELAKWHVWRDGATLWALATGLKQAQSFELGDVPRLIVRPALVSRSGALDLFLLSAAGDELRMVRFPPPKFKGAPAPAGILWRVASPKRLVAGRAALAPDAAGSARHVLLVEQDGDDLNLYHVRVDPEGKPGAWGSVRIPGARAIAGTEPGLHVDDSETVRASLPFERDPITHHLALADVRFEPDGRVLTAPAIADLGRPATAPIAAAAAYDVTGNTNPRREWAVLLENREVLHAARPGPAQPLRGDPVRPLELLPLSAGTYLLTVGPAGNPDFALLD